MMARITHVLRQVADRGSSSIVKANGKGNNQQREAKNGFKSSSEMVAQLESFFETREQELKAREEALEKRFQLFDATYRQAGNPSDVLHLNVGGSTNVAVLRRTLTHFENSMLASRFSGRWDDELEKTKCGSFFIDQDPQVFLPLLNHLRNCDQKTPNQITIPPPPPPTLEFCCMLEYYGLMSYVYPQKWRTVSGNGDGVVMTREGTEGDSLAISSTQAWCEFALDVVKPLRVTSFTAVVDKNSCGLVGWDVDLRDGRCLGYDSSESLFAFDNFDGTFMNSGSVTQKVDTSQYEGRKFPVTIRCTRDLTTNTYSIHVLNKYGDECGRDTFHCNKDMSPHISLDGTVRVSNVVCQF